MLSRTSPALQLLPRCRECLGDDVFSLRKRERVGERGHRLTVALPELTVCVAVSRAGGEQEERVWGPGGGRAQRFPRSSAIAFSTSFCR